MADRAAAVQQRQQLIAQFDGILNRTALYGPADALRDTWRQLKAALLAADPVQGAPPQDEECDEEEVPHSFNPRPNYDDLQIWCKDCEYHRDHKIHAAALPSRVVPPEPGTVADVRAALGESLSNELADAVLETRVVPPEPEKEQA